MMIRIRGLITNSGGRSEVGSSATGLIVVHVIFDRGQFVMSDSLRHWLNNRTMMMLLRSSCMFHGNAHIMPQNPTLDSSGGGGVLHRSIAMEFVDTVTCPAAGRIVQLPPRIDAT